MLKTPTVEDHSMPDTMLVASKNYMDVVSGIGPQVAREAGLLITSEDIRSIRRYTKSGLELPTELMQVEHLLGNGYSGVAGLEPATILELYKAIQFHCVSWSPVEAGMKTVGSDLNVFAGSLVSAASGIVDYIRSLESFQLLKVGELTAEQLAAMPPVALMPGDQPKLAALGALFDDLKEYVKIHSASTRSVSDSISSFKDVLKFKISPAVSLKVKLVSTKETDEKINELTASIQLLDERIAQKSSEYSTYCRNAVIAVWWGPVSILTASTIYGIKAELVRKERNALLDEKRAIEQQLRQLNKLLSLLIALEVSLQDIETRIDGAVSGVSHLESQWVLIANLVDASKELLKGLDDSRFLAILVSRFDVLISHWNDIKKQSFDLLTAFNNVLEESQD